MTTRVAISYLFHFPRSRTEYQLRFTGLVLDQLRLRHSSCVSDQAVVR